MDFFGLFFSFLISMYLLLEAREGKERETDEGAVT